MSKTPQQSAASIDKLIRDNPNDFFSDEETERRSTEVMRRFSGQPRRMSLKTGQNLQAPFLSDAELKTRGYPCEWDCE